MSELAGGGAKAPDGGLLADEDRTGGTTPVTVIVQLDEGTVGVPWYRRIFGLSSSTKHEVVKDRITSAVSGALPGVSTSGGTPITDVKDYSTVIDGFAIEIPRGALEAVRGVEGVKAAFVEELHQRDIETPALDAVQPPANASSLAMTHADSTAYKGDGQVIAVIDTGLEVGHPAFSGDLDDSTVKLHEGDVSSLKSKLAVGKEGVYVSEKIAFAYDYADNDADVVPHSSADLSHGTHVSGIATGNGGTIRGTAPNAQLMALKVARDSDGALPDSAILGALDDVGVLEPDSVNMSFGSDAGMSDEAASIYADAYKVLREKGITLNVAAGNSYSSAHGNTSGANLPYASDPDSSTVDEPSTFQTSLSVASVDNTQEGLPCFTAAGRQIGYMEGHNPLEEGMASFGDIESGTYRYVDAGEGKAADIAAMVQANPDGIEGAFALVRRGGTSDAGKPMTFEDKVKALAPYKPTAIIIYDNEDSDSLTRPAVQTTTIPIAFISKANGEAMLAAADHNLVIDKGARLAPSTDYVMSDFSSWGVSPDLTLKPEISAPGGNIYSALPGDKYGYMSGTSMATPQMAGIAAQVRQRVASDKRFSSFSDSDKHDVVTNLLMGTAHPVVDAHQGTGAYYSPRKQGAGIADALAATTATVYPTVDGARSPSRPKADLGDGTSGWTFGITLRNVGSEARSYALSSQALSELVNESGLICEHSKNFRGEGITVSYSGEGVSGTSEGATITVPAGGTARVGIAIAVEQSFADYVGANLPKGTFIDGFVEFASQTEGEPGLTVPFLGFYGNWGAANVFDTKWSDEGAQKAHIYKSALASTTTGMPLGVNPLQKVGPLDQVKPDPSRYIVSNSGWSVSPNSIQPVTGTLRSTAKMTYTYTNEAGETVRSYTFDGAHKSLFNPRKMKVLYAEARIGSPIFDGRDEQGGLVPDGAYKLTISTDTDGPNSSHQELSYDFTMDTVAPEISNLTTTGEGAEKTISFDVADSSPLAAVDFADPDSGGWFHRVLVADDGTVEADGTHRYHFDVRVSDLQKSWTEQGGKGKLPATPLLHAWDFGINASKSHRVVVEPIPMTSLTLDQSSLSLVPGQNAKLGVSHEPAEANMTDVTWSSSDQAVATVSDSGVVTGVGQGEADIVVASAADPAVSATAHVKVAPVSDETGIALSDSPIIIPTSGQAGVSALLAPSLRGSSVTWALDVEGASIQPSADTLSATITAGDRSARGTVTATVATPAGDKTATAPVEVHQSDYDDFVIDADGVLTQYRGSGSTISVPDTVTAIADEALRGVNAERITIPATVRTIGNRAFADARRLTTVVFEDTAARPSQLTELGGALVDNDYSLDEILLPSKVVKLGGGAFSNSTIKRLSLPDSLTAIPSDLAERSSQLNEVTIGDAVTQIGASAFSENTSLGELRIRQADGSTKAGLPSALTAIGASAFSGTRFASLDLPASVSTIGDSAFMKAPLTHLGLNKGLVSVGEQAFSGTLLTEVELPDSVTTVGKGAFKAMPELTKAHLGPNVAADQLVSGFTLSPKLSSITVDSANASYESVDGVLYTKDHTHLVAYPMAKNSGGSYTVVDGTARIDDEAFQQAPLRQISFPASLRSIGASAFANAQLTDVVLPDQFETLEAHAFQATANLASANLGGTVRIGDSAFDSSSLTSVDFRTDLNRLEAVGSMAFSGAPVRVLVFPDSLKSVGAFAFENNPHLEEVRIGAALTDLDTGFLAGSDVLRALTVSPDNPVYSAENNVLYAKRQDGTHLVLSLPTNTFTEYSVRPGTVQIDAQAFRNNKALQRVVLPEGLKALKAGSFNNASSLTEIVLPDSLETVDGLYSTAIEFIEFGTRIHTIDENAFKGNVPDRMIVRGGVGGSFTGSTDSTGARATAAFFGEGMKRINYGYGGSFPQTLVVPSTVEVLALGTYALSTEQLAASHVYVAAGEGSVAWSVARAAMEKAGLDPASQLHRYVDPALSLSSPVIDQAGDASKVQVEAGQTIEVTAMLTGGVPNGREARFVEVAPGGAETVVSDWAAMGAAQPSPAPGANAGAEPGAQAPAGADEGGAQSGSDQAQSGSDQAQSGSSQAAPADQAASTQSTASGQVAGAADGPAGDGGAPSSSAAFTWVPSVDGASLRVEARDATFRVVVGVVGSALPSAPVPGEGQWVQDSVGWWYRFGDGTYPRGQALVIDGATYRFDESGYLRTGWVRDVGYWFHHGASGAMSTGWLVDGGAWYYLIPGWGAMATGWVNDGGTWYYMGFSGRMATGWVADGGYWYYLDASGHMATGWKQIGGKWYEFGPSGALKG
ncbi:hypothetical protein EHS14_05980 [Schaalia georgiae]|nr:hypothetical protein EHS14_05980 [Schaalia georgiae]